MQDRDIALRVIDVSKHYLLFERPEHRLKQSIVPRLQRLVGLEPKRYFRDFAALQGVSFDVRQGETVGLVGRNGSGKSTVLQIVCGTLRPSTGSVEVTGAVSPLLELGAGFNPDFTGRENVYMNAAILGLTRREVDERFDEIVRFADIGPFLDQPVKTYSSGMFVRLAFAVAVSVDPDILVVDEALAVGDEAFQRKCYARIEEIQGRGAAVLFVSHSAQVITQLCSRVLLFDAGEVLMDGPPKEVLGHYQRLLSASKDDAIKIREDIRQGAIPQKQGVLGNGAGKRDEPLRPDIALFDPALVSQSTLVVGTGAAEIRDVRLLDENGARVNVVRTGMKLTYAYDVHFLHDATDVAFGMVLKTVSGLSLAGANNDFKPSQRVSKARAGSVLRVAFTFTCRLLPGTYFTNAGVVGEVAGDRVTLQRILDAIAFRVVEGADTYDVAHFALDTELKIQSLDTVKEAR